MSFGLSRLKGLAEGLNMELEGQNKLIDDINTKADKTGFKLSDTNKQINGILKKWCTTPCTVKTPITLWELFNFWCTIHCVALGVFFFILAIVGNGIFFLYWWHCCYIFKLVFVPV